MHFNRLNCEKLNFVLSQMLALLCHLNPAEEWSCGFVTWSIKLGKWFRSLDNATVAELIWSQFHSVLVFFHP